MAEKDKAPVLNPGSSKGCAGSSPAGSADEDLALAPWTDLDGLVPTGYVDPESSEPMPTAESIVKGFKTPEGTTDFDVVQHLVRMIKLLDEKINEVEGRLAQ